MRVTIVVTGLMAAIMAMQTAQNVVAKGPPETPEAKAGGDLTPTFDLKDPSRIQAGKARFESTCAAFCHGFQPALFIGRTDLEPPYIYATIRDGGRGATPMPPWGDVFTPEEIWELVAYIKSLGGEPAHQ